MKVGRVFVEMALLVVLLVGLVSGANINRKSDAAASKSSVSGGGSGPTFMAKHNGFLTWFGILPQDLFAVAAIKKPKKQTEEKKVEAATESSAKVIVNKVPKITSNEIPGGDGDDDDLHQGHDHRHDEHQGHDDHRGHDHHHGNPYVNHKVKESKVREQETVNTAAEKPTIQPQLPEPQQPQPKPQPQLPEPQPPKPQPSVDQASKEEVKLSTQPEQQPPMRQQPGSQLRPLRPPQQPLRPPQQPLRPPQQPQQQPLRPPQQPLRPQQQPLRPPQQPLRPPQQPLRPPQQPLRPPQQPATPQQQPLRPRPSQPDQIPAKTPQQGSRQPTRPGNLLAPGQTRETTLQGSSRQGQTAKRPLVRPSTAEQRPEQQVPTAGSYPSPYGWPYQRPPPVTPYRQARPQPSNVFGKDGAPAKGHKGFVPSEESNEKAKEDGKKEEKEDVKSNDKIRMPVRSSVRRWPSRFVRPSFMPPRFYGHYHGHRYNPIAYQRPTATNATLKANNETAKATEDSKAVKLPTVLFVRPFGCGPAFGSVPGTCVQIKSECPGNSKAIGICGVKDHSYKCCSTVPKNVKSLAKAVAFPGLKCRTSQGQVGKCRDFRQGCQTEEQASALCGRITNRHLCCVVNDDADI